MPSCFIGIFITIAPVIAILKAGSDGSLAAVINAVSGPDGEPIPLRYFWFTGILSGYLDNAPTYVVFLKPRTAPLWELMGQYRDTLMAISMGAVFMGALSYIGNARTFMVKAIAERQQGADAQLLWLHGLVVLDPPAYLRPRQLRLPLS